MHSANYSPQITIDKCSLPSDIWKLEPAARGTRSTSGREVGKTLQASIYLLTRHDDVNRMLAPFPWGSCAAYQLEQGCSYRSVPQLKATNMGLVHKANQNRSRLCACKNHREGTLLLCTPPLAESWPKDARASAAVARTSGSRLQTWDFRCCMWAFLPHFRHGFYSNKLISQTKLASRRQASASR
jgi:hypothetical protein